MSKYTAGGPSSSFEKESALALEKVTKQLTALQKEISATVGDAIAVPRRSTVYWRGVESKLKKLYSEISAVYAEHAIEHIPQAYKKSLAVIGAEIEKTKKITATARRTTRILANSQGSKQIVSAMVRSAINHMNAAVAGGVKNAATILTATQQAYVAEWTIDAVVAEAYATGDLIGSFPRLLAVRDPQYAAMLEAFKEERVLQAGSKKYTASYYGEMVSRTKFHDAQSYAALQQAGNYRTDLMVVSNHNTTTALCQEFEAKTFSISGKDDRFPVLTMTPPYHPNCLHLLFPTFETAMEVDGTLQAQSDFSQGKTDAPPVPKGYVPIKDRGTPEKETQVAHRELNKRYAEMSLLKRVEAS